MWRQPLPRLSAERSEARKCRAGAPAHCLDPVVDFASSVPSAQTFSALSAIMLLPPAPETRPHSATIPRMKRHILLCLTLLLAQAAAPEVEITAEPHHHLTFENKSVRVFNVEIPHGSDTLMHWHRHDYISVSLGPAEILNSVKGKPPVTLKFQDGDTRFAHATFAHVVSDQAAEPFRNVTIQILEDATTRKSPSNRS